MEALHVLGHVLGSYFGGFVSIILALGLAKYDKFAWLLKYALRQGGAAGQGEG